MHVVVDQLLGRIEPVGVVVARQLVADPPALGVLQKSERIGGRSRTTRFGPQRGRYGILPEVTVVAGLGIPLERCGDRQCGDRQ